MYKTFPGKNHFERAVPLCADGVLTTPARSFDNPAFYLIALGNI